MIIDVTGFGWSGSGAVLDLLEEYDDVCFPQTKSDKPWEFTFLQCVDGIADLEWHLMHMHRRIFDSDKAFRRFLALAERLCKHPLYRYESIFDGQFYKACEEYVNELTGINFTSRTFYDRMEHPAKEIVRSAWNKSVDATIGKICGENAAAKVYFRDFRPIRVAYEPENFIEATTRLTSRLMGVLRKGQDKPLVMDHLLPPDIPQLFMKYFSEPVKCIIVRRDPRDLYVLAKVVYHGMLPLPTDNVKDFIWFYRHTMEKTKSEDSSQILNVWFEDCVYNYETTKQRIENFVGISKHIRKMLRFKPDVSMVNTRIYENYPPLLRDIKQIEKELPGSLYPYKGERVKGLNINNIF